jgi:hypothetical protein
VPSALDVLHPGRVAVLYEGGVEAVAAQVEATRRLVGGDEADGAVWGESRSRQGAARGRIRFAPGELASFLAGADEAVVRPSSGVAYVPGPVPDETPEPLRRLQARVKERFDPAGVLT